MSNLKNPSEFNLLTVDEINEQIKAREKLLDHMVGWYATGLLHGEIKLLKDRKKYLQEHVNADLFEQLKNKRKQPV